MATKTAALTSLFACFTLVPFGECGWDLINNFEQFEDGTDVVDLYPLANTEGSMPEAWVYAVDVRDPDSNKAYFLDYGFNIGGGSDTWVSIPLEEEVPEDSYLSIYFRLYTEGYTPRWHFGTTMKKTPVPETDPVEYQYLSSWGDHNTIFRFVAGGLFSARSDGYKDSFPEFRMEIFEWYEFVIILHNSSNPEEKKWRVYRRDPGQFDWILMEFDPENPHSKLDFRNKDNDSIKALVLSTNVVVSTCNRDIWFIDDIYVANGEPVIGDARLGEELSVNFESGEILADHLSESWCGYRVFNEFKDVYTEDWLGWVNVTDKPWIYSYLLKNWLYVEENFVDESGGWVYTSN